LIVARERCRGFGISPPGRFRDDCRVDFVAARQETRAAGIGREHAVVEHVFLHMIGDAQSKLGIG
jgi:hypothetical protein